MPQARNNVSRPRSSKFSVAFALTVRARRAAAPIAVSPNNDDKRTVCDDSSASTATAFAPEPGPTSRVPCLKVPVIQQRVPAAKVDQFTRPGLDRATDQARPTAAS